MNMAESTMLELTMEGVNSTVPSEVTNPRFSYKVLTPEGIFDTNDGILQTRMHIVVCCRKQGDGGDSGWHVGGWIKESLGRALVEVPILAGRLARCEDGGLEIVSNDSGVRIVEAQSPLSLLEFLEFKEKDHVKTELVSWKDVDETHPQFSPLFYIQVTNFQCGGYSVGISYSLLLADPSCMAKFLNRWAEIHRGMAYEGEVPKMPLFYAPSLAKRVGYRPPTTTTAAKNSNSSSSTITAIFNISTEEKLTTGSEILMHIGLRCIEEAEGKFGLKMGSNFALITKEPNGDNKVEKAPRRCSFASPKGKGLQYEIISFSKWEDLETNKICFGRDNFPVDVSHWVACNNDALQGVVLVVISSPWEGKFGIKVYVTFP